MQTVRDMARAEDDTIGRDAHDLHESAAQRKLRLAPNVSPADSSSASSKSGSHPLLNHRNIEEQTVNHLSWSGRRCQCSDREA